MGFKKPTYTQIPNEVFDRLMPKLSPSAFKVLCAICRKTFGWHRENEKIPISISLLCEMTGLSNRVVIQALYSICPDYIMSYSESGSTTRYKMVFDDEYYVEDESMQKEVPMTNSHTPYDESSQVPMTNSHRLKESIKESLKKNTIYADTQDVLQYLNAKANRGYTKVNEHTTARLKEYKKEDLMAVIDWKVCEWAGNGDMAKFLRQETLFSPKHFDTYLDDARRNLAGVEKKAYDKYCEEFYQAHMNLPLEERRGKRPLAIEEWRKENEKVLGAHHNE